MGARVAAIVAAAALVAASGAQGEPRGALWAVVRGCKLNHRLTGAAWPCLAVDARRGVVVVPDPHRRTQVLLVPAARVPGVESPALLAAETPNYWALAWEARSHFQRRAGPGASDREVGLAINSALGRTQDQLHIHIDCLRPSVRRAVDRAAPRLTEDWTPLGRRLARRRAYLVRWLPRDALATADPFKLLASEAQGGLGDWALAMVAAAQAPDEAGFVLLAHRADPSHGDLGAAEELLDHRCTALHAAPPAEPSRAAKP